MVALPIETGMLLAIVVSLPHIARVALPDSQFKRSPFSYSSFALSKDAEVQRQWQPGSHPKRTLPQRAICTGCARC